MAMINDNFEKLKQEFVYMMRNKSMYDFCFLPSDNDTNNTILFFLKKISDLQTQIKELKSK